MIENKIRLITSVLITSVFQFSLLDFLLLLEYERIGVVYKIYSYWPGPTFLAHDIVLGKCPGGRVSSPQAKVFSFEGAFEHFLLLLEYERIGVVYKIYSYWPGPTFLAHDIVLGKCPGGRVSSPQAKVFSFEGAFEHF